MEILVDDAPYQTDRPDQSVRELAQEVCQIGPDESPRLVTSLRCDGEPVTDERLNDVLQTPASRFGKLEIHTQPLARLVQATLDQAVHLFEEAGANRLQAADLLAEGKREAAMQDLQQFLQAWQQVQETLAVSAQALGDELEKTEINGQGISAILQMVKEPLASLKDAMEQGDLVVVADILRYELEEPCQYWLDLLCHLRDRAKTLS